MITKPLNKVLIQAPSELFGKIKVFFEGLCDTSNNIHKLNCRKKNNANILVYLKKYISSNYFHSSAWFLF